VSPSAVDPPEVLERVEAGLPFVERIAKKLARTLGSQVEQEDLAGHGRLGLLDAARRYDPARRIPFDAYAQFRIRGAMLDAVRQLTLSRRTYERMRASEAAQLFSEGMLEQTFVPTSRGAPAMGHRLAETLAAMTTAVAMGVMAETGYDDSGALAAISRTNPEQLLEKEQLLSLVRQCVDELPHDELALVKRHYFEGVRFDQVAAELGLSKSWASRLHARAVSRITKRLRRAEGRTRRRARPRAPPQRRHGR
jgi:RNA polymerase sigma factor for flagellar operon FliA